MEEWHQRFGHISTEALEKMKKTEPVVGMDIKTKTSEVCEDCAINKCHRSSHPSKSTSKAEKPGITLHIDNAGPITPAGVGGARFLLICKDEFSGFRQTK